MKRDRAVGIIAWLLTVVVPCFGTLTAVARVNLVVDPGHGGCSGLNPCGTQTYITGYDTCSLCTKYSEKWVNLEVGLELWTLLAFEPPDPGTTHYWSFAYSRTSDSAIEPAERAYFANLQDADRLLSIHHNYDPDISTQYAVVMYSA